MTPFFVASDNETEVFERAFKQKLPLMIKGPTGCGKSQLVEFMADRLKVPLIKVACNEDTSATDLLGRYIIRGGETVWQDGPVTRAVRSGSILYLDEIAEAREDVVVAIHPLTDHRREIYVDKTNEVLRAPSGFMCIASYNPGYQRGLKEMKPSTKQRFVHLTMNYLTPQKEATVLMEIAGIPETMANKLTAFAAHVRQMKELQFKETISTRLLVHAASLISDGMNPRRACHQSIAHALTDDLETVNGLKDLIDLSL